MLVAHECATSSVVFHSYCKVFLQVYCSPINHSVARSYLPDVSKIDCSSARLRPTVHFHVYVVP